ncbi:LrgB family protein [Desulfovibrio aminophilus]|uniref:LrgB family protein n=1 Tax=Desulfovibrio aminophilus TaxID=81425 RepID=UPI003395D612
MTSASLLHSPLAAGLFWSAATVALYCAARRVHRLRPSWWTSPLALAPILIVGLAVALHAGYGEYNQGTRWLLTMLGPVTVAFALPIFEQREMIRRHWPVLAVGVVAGSVIAMLTAWGLASLLGLSESVRLSLMPRSVSTPFAMTVSGDIGGVPDLTAVFVVLTGVFGAALGEILLHVLPLRTSLARGALFGMGAHGAGVAQARQVGGEEGAIASLVMILAGLCNVLAAPFIAFLIH